MPQAQQQRQAVHRGPFGKHHQHGGGGQYGKGWPAQPQRGNRHGYQHDTGHHALAKLAAAPLHNHAQRPPKRRSRRENSSSAVASAGPSKSGHSVSVTRNSA